MYLRSFSAKGYRSFCNTVVLDRPGPIVVLFGDNNAGKSNLLRAIDLFHRAIRLDLVRLLDVTARNPEAFYSDLDQDPWMFYTPGDAVVELYAEVAAAADSTESATFGVRIARVAEGITLELTDWCGCGSDSPLARAQAAYREMIAAQTSDDPEDWEAPRDELATLIADWERMARDFAPGMSIHRGADTGVAVSALREEFTQLARSVDLHKRRRARWALERFGEIVPGLADGRLESIENPPAYPNDFGWLSQDSLLPLDQLGSGSQAVFSVLAALALADTQSVGIEEPESQLNAHAQQRLAATLPGIVGRDSPTRQLVIATHSPAFASDAYDIRLVERRGKSTSVTQEPPRKMGEFASIPPVASGEDRTASLLNFDGSIRLPDYVLDDLESSKGHFVYFVRARPTGFRIVAAPEMQEMLDGDGT